MEKQKTTAATVNASTTGDTNPVITKNRYDFRELEGYLKKRRFKGDLPPRIVKRQKGGRGFFKRM